MLMLDKKITGEFYDLVILGGGVAGLAAAMTAGQLGLKVLVLEKAIFGGSVAVLETVTDYPGIAGTSGWELTQTMAGQARDSGCELIDSIGAVELVDTGDGYFMIKCSDSHQFRGRSVIVATGGEPYMLELADEAYYARRGIHTCAQCAGARYADKTVAVAGNSSWAVRAAKHLLDLGCTVLYITRDSEICGNLRNTIRKLVNHERFRFVGGCHVTGLYGEEKLEEVLITSLAGGAYQKIKISAVFVYRGIKPNSNLVSARRDRKGFLEVDENFMTSAAGIFAAGRVVRDDLPLQVMVGDGSRAALAAYVWIQAEI